MTLSEHLTSSEPQAEQQTLQSSDQHQTKQLSHQLTEQQLNQQTKPSGEQQTQQLSDQLTAQQTQQRELQRAIDGLSLTQALADFELANARVLDLTARLVEAQERVRRYGADADVARSEKQGLSDARDRALVELDNVVRELDAVRAALHTRADEVEMLNAELHKTQIAAAASEHEAHLARAELAALRGSKSYRVVARVNRVIRTFR